MIVCGYNHKRWTQPCGINAIVLLLQEYSLTKGGRAVHGQQLKLPSALSSLFLKGGVCTDGQNQHRKHKTPAVMRRGKEYRFLEVDEGRRRERAVCRAAYRTARYNEAASGRTDTASLRNRSRAADSSLSCSAVALFGRSIRLLKQRERDTGTARGLLLQH